MKQSKSASFTEAIINTLAGFGISLAAQWFFLPLLGVAIEFRQNLIFAVIMTVISIGRTFVLRRLFEFLHIRVPMSPFMLAVLAERRRQIDAEGWTLAHDDEHQPGELARAGAAYAIAAGELDGGERYGVDRIWPWSLDWWKPQNFRRDLVRAGSLIIAEGEKLDRTRKLVTAKDFDHLNRAPRAHDKSPSEQAGAP